MAVVDAVTAEISGSEAGSFISLAAVADSDTDDEPLLLANTASSSIGVYITSTQLYNLPNLQS